MNNEFKKGDLVECRLGLRYFLKEEIEGGRGWWAKECSDTAQIHSQMVTYLPEESFHLVYESMHTEASMGFEQLMKQYTK